MPKKGVLIVKYVHRIVVLIAKLDPCEWNNELDSGNGDGFARG